MRKGCLPGTFSLVTATVPYCWQCGQIIGFILELYKLALFLYSIRKSNSKYVIILIFPMKFVILKLLSKLKKQLIGE